MSHGGKSSMSVELRNSEVNSIPPSCLSFTDAKITLSLFYCNFSNCYLIYVVTKLSCYSLVLSHILFVTQCDFYCFLFLTFSLVFWSHLSFCVICACRRFYETVFILHRVKHATLESSFIPYNLLLWSNFPSIYPCSIYIEAIYHFERKKDIFTKRIINKKNIATSPKK